MEQKVPISQDALYEYLMAHDVKLTRLAELMGKSVSVISSCFLHHNDMQGNPRSFNRRNVEAINLALPQIAAELRTMILQPDKNQQRTNSWGRTYYPTLVEPIKAIGQYLNITALVERILGWGKRKKESILVTRSNKAYGNISEADALAINTELLSVAAVLDSYELILPESSSSTD